MFCKYFNSSLFPADTFLNVESQIDQSLCCVCLQCTQTRNDVKNNNWITCWLLRPIAKPTASRRDDNLVLRRYQRNTEWNKTDQTTSMRALQATEIYFVQPVDEHMPNEMAFITSRHAAAIHKPIQKIQFCRYHRTDRYRRRFCFCWALD